MKLVVAAPPFIRRGISSNKILWAVGAALVPGLGVAVYAHGLRTLAILALAIIGAAATESGCRLLAGKKAALPDGGAMITGILLALLVPIQAPLWLPLAGAVFAIAIAREAFGGSGCNIFNPALAGWIFITMAWGGHLVVGPEPVRAFQFINYQAVRLAETAPLALVVPALLLLPGKCMDWRMPFWYLTATLVFALLLGQECTFMPSGVYVLGVFFFVTDPVTTPVTRKGRVIFGLGCGLLTVLYAKSGNFAEGVGLAILLMNALTPLLDRFTIPRPVVVRNIYEEF